MYKDNLPSKKVAQGQSIHGPDLRVGKFIYIVSSVDYADRRIYSAFIKKRMGVHIHRARKDFHKLFTGLHDLVQKVWISVDYL